MSPEIRINGEVVADVPDETGWYLLPSQEWLYVNVSEIDPASLRQYLKLQSRSMGGVRIVELNDEGNGNTRILSRKGIKGDGLQPTLDVALRNRPIRYGSGTPGISYHGNPRWSRR